MRPTPLDPPDAHPSRPPAPPGAGSGDPVPPSCGARPPDDATARRARPAGVLPPPARRHDTDAPTTAPTTGPPPPAPARPGCRERAGLVALATGADAELAEHRIDGALIRVAPDGTLSWRSLHGAHPLQVLVGFVAPPEWAAIGVSSAGWAHPLDATGRARRRPDAPSVQVTVLFGRSGVAVGVLRKGDGCDASCPTRPRASWPTLAAGRSCCPPAPPAGHDAELWALTWLDRIVEVRGPPAARRSWPAGRPSPPCTRRRARPARRPTRRRWPRRPWRWPRRGRGPGCGPSRSVVDVPGGRAARRPRRVDG